jgi:hypothetical protein
VGHPLTVETVPSTAASLAGSFASTSQSAPAFPSTITAVLAAFASTHVGAATETVCQLVAAGLPVRGSMM